MRTRTRLSRCVEWVLWCVLGLTLAAWIGGGWLTATVSKSGGHYGNVYWFGLGRGVIGLQFAPMNPYGNGPSEVEEFVWFVEKTGPWTIDLIPLSDTDTLRDRLGLCMPVIEFDFPCALDVSCPCWLATIITGVLIFRVRRGRHMLMRRAARRRRVFGAASCLIAAGCVGMWYATLHAFDIFIEVPFVGANLQEGITVLYTDSLRWPEVTVRKQIINRTNGPGWYGDIILDGNIEGLASFQFARFPTWVPALVLMTLAVYQWQSARFVRMGICDRCGYDLTGNTSGKCSECGEPVPAGEKIKTAGNMKPTPLEANSGGTPAR